MVLKKTTLGIFVNFEFLIFNDFVFEKFKFNIVAYGEAKNLKKSERRAK